MRRIQGILLFVFVCVQLDVRALGSEHKLNICGDGAEWPPYIYWERSKNGAKTGKISGYTVDLLKEIFSKKGIEITFHLPPWSRCLAEVERGGRYHIAVDSSFSHERDKKFLLTKHYYEITPKLFYSSKHYPSGFPDFSNSEELLKIGNICGLQGYNYVGFLKGLENSRLDMGAKDFNAVTAKTKAGFCQAFLARSEVIKGFKKIGSDFSIGKAFLSKRLPNSRREKFYMLISRKISEADSLKNTIDAGIKTCRSNGCMKNLEKKYFN